MILVPRPLMLVVLGAASWISLLGEVEIGGATSAS